ncbi:MAG: helix-hairpin-helix domain-containing protein [Saprospiraceae bacterium]
MITLFTFCDIPWWLSWLLPFLLGLALGWLLWSRFKSLFNQSQSELSQTQINLTAAEATIADQKHIKAELEGELALCRGRLRESETSQVAKGAKPVTKLAVVATPKVSPEEKWAMAIGDGQLQIIEGIGPKMESVLKENGISDFSLLAASSPVALRAILDKYGDKYRIIDPTTWPQQANLAKQGQYKELISLQKSLDTGRSDVLASETDSKLEKFLMKIGIIKRWKQDDLKAVEGIGPKIESLLKEAGIHTWASLSSTKLDTIKDILDKAGSRYQLADPTTWPKQAALAAEGKWDELQHYQDQLDGGREK